MVVAENDPKLARLCNLLPTESRPKVISGRNVRTVMSYVAVNFEVASSNSFRDITKSFRDDDNIMRKAYASVSHGKTALVEQLVLGLHCRIGPRSSRRYLGSRTAAGYRRPLMDVWQSSQKKKILEGASFSK